MKPNIIFLMTDQQRWDALGVVNPLVKTPNLDRMARDGVLYRQAVCQAPLCVPSRYSMMLGQYASTVGVLTNADAIVEDSNLPCEPLPERFRAAGYQTAGFGKTHWNHGKSDPRPSRRGFEIRAIGQPRDSALYEDGARMMGDEAPEGLAAYFKETEVYGAGEEEVAGYIGGTSTVPAEHHRDGWVAQQCLDFIENDMDPNRPLFLYLSFLKPHAGFNVPAGFEDLYRLEDIPSVAQPPWSEEQHTHLSRRNTPWLDQRYESWRSAWNHMNDVERRRSTLRYWANCSWLDACFGQVLEALKETGRLENCLVVFTSDHGDMMGERNHRFSKYCLYDSSVRVPLILSGSCIADAQRGSVSERPAELIDLAPTLLDAAGLPPDPRLPGESLLGGFSRQGTFCEYHGGGMEEVAPAPAFMWRTPEWKLILYGEGTAEEQGSTKGELYDLKRDPNEWFNLYDRPSVRAVQQRMTQELENHLLLSNEFAVDGGQFPVLSQTNQRNGNEDE